MKRSFLYSAELVPAHIHLYRKLGARDGLVRQCSTPFLPPSTEVVARWHASRKGESCLSTAGQEVCSKGSRGLPLTGEGEGPWDCLRITGPIRWRSGCASISGCLARRLGLGAHPHCRAKPATEVPGQIIDEDSLGRTSVLPLEYNLPFRITPAADLGGISFEGHAAMFLNVGGAALQ